MPRKKKDYAELTANSLEFKENKTPLEHEIVMQKKDSQRRRREGKPQKVMNLVRDYSERKDEEPKGKPTGICKTCGRTFDQDFSEERNAYSSWRTCPDCRKERARKKEEKIERNGEREVAVATLPYTPYPWQAEAEEAFEKHRFIVLACGNRSGKDRMTIMVGIKYFVECLNENRLIDNPDIVPPVLWWQLAPTEKMAKQNWRELKQFFPKDWIVSCSDSTFTMETIGGGIIEVRSGYNPNDLVGVGLDLVTITEAARFSDLSLAWANLQARLGSPGRGRKKDRLGKPYGQGKAIINSSPLGRNDFYDLFCYGQPSSEFYSSDWWSAQYPWTCNPANKEFAERPVQGKYGVISTEESIRRQIGERAFRSNYLADFLAEDNVVFKNFEANCVISIYDEEHAGAKTKKQREEFIDSWMNPIPGQTYVAGYDPATGSSGDSPALVIRCKETGRIVRAFDLYGKTYDEQFDFVGSICKMYNYAEVHWLRTGHTAIEGQFSKRGLIEVPIDEQGQKKGQLVQTLELAVENKDVHVLHDGSAEIQTLVNQMNDYSEKKGKYSNDKMPHDDFVSAMYAAFSDYSVSEIPVYYCSLMRGL